MSQCRSKLAKAISEDGRTAREIARVAGINATTLSLVVNGRRVPRFETTAKLSRALNRSPADLGLPELASITRGGAQ